MKQITLWMGALVLVYGTALANTTMATMGSANGQTGTINSTSGNGQNNQGIPGNQANEEKNREPFREGACGEIDRACKGAGFYVGGANVGKGFWMNCFDPIVKQGQTVPGVNVSPQVVQACIQHEQKHRGQTVRQSQGGTAGQPNNSNGASQKGVIAGAGTTQN